MKKIYIFISMLICIVASMTSCYSNKSNPKENRIDSAAIAQAKADSIARVDSIARAYSIARADSIAKANNLAVGMKVSEALQKPGVKKGCIDNFDGAHEGEALILTQDGKKFLTNIGYSIRLGDPICSNLKFNVMPESYEQDLTLIRAKDCAESAKIVKEIK